jgi:riboflavin kinase/FMN adenylyltransferase
MTRIVRAGDGTPNLGSATVALGVFDGVHLGHQALVRDAVAQAAARGVGSCVLTFDRDPDQVVEPDRAAPQLMTLEDKISALVELGPDAVLVVPFTEALASLTPESFLSGIVLASVSPVVCIVGHDFRFGNRAAGDVTALRELGARHGFDVVARDLLTVDGIPVTSSRIRDLVAQGDVVAAARLLGRLHRVAGEVVHGRGEGFTLGTPTANIRTAPFAAVPADGVYAAFATLREERFPAAVSLGVPPTFPDATDICEAHLIGYDGPPFYGERVTLEFVERLREQRRFAHEADLAAAIAADVERAARLLRAR